MGGNGMEPVAVNHEMRAPWSVGGDISRDWSPCIECHIFLHPLSASLRLASPGPRKSPHSEKCSFGRGSAGAVHSLAVISQGSVFFPRKVCWLSSLLKVMIDWKARPNFQGETWHHLKSTWFRVALRTESWTRSRESLAKVHELLWQTQTAFRTDFSQFSHWLEPSFTQFRRHLAFWAEKWQARVLFSRSVLSGACEDNGNPCLAHLLLRALPEDQTGHL